MPEKHRGWRKVQLSMVLPVVLSLHTAAAGPRSLAPSSRASTTEYRVVHGWPVVPDGHILGWVVSGVGTDSAGDVFVFHRAGREWPSSDELSLAPIPHPTVLRFQGRTGVVTAAWGADRFAMPHGLSIDSQDNVWVTDVALHQVFKFSHDGELVLTLGEKGVAGNDRLHFNRPTKVAVARDGSFYVSDGYRNNRVAKFTADGQFVAQWGVKGSGAGQFDLPHGIAVDRQGRVYVADRGNARVQVFDAAGHYITEWQGPELGRPFDVAIAPDGRVFVADGGDIPSEPPDRSRVVVLSPDGRVVGHFGSFGVYDGQFYRAHDLAVAKDGSVYVGDAGGRVQKFVRH